jgi:predicted AAA+ superfamily ATPase
LLFSSGDAKIQIGMSYIRRLIPLDEVLRSKSVFLLGPRRTGKSALLRNQLKFDQTFDLLKSDTFQSLSFRPASLRETLRPQDRVVVIDEIQKLPSLMDEVHSLIEERGIRFVLTGSSARKLKRSHTSLMAGRARRLTLHPFCYPEVSAQFDLNKVLHTGGLPPIFLAPDADSAWSELKDYVGDYLREEILAEALVRKIEAFSRFLPVAARMNGELLNFEAVASDAQVPARTIREYFSVLEDTLIGRAIEPMRFKGARSRKAIATSKFYFFDCGVVNALLGRSTLSPQTPEYGSLFETWVYLEILAYLDYRKSSEAEQVQFWRNPGGEEVDFVIRREIGIEVKSTHTITERHLKGLDALHSIQPLKLKWIVCQEAREKKIGGVGVLPWRAFVEKLWAGELGF